MAYCNPSTSRVTLGSGEPSLLLNTLDTLQTVKSKEFYVQENNTLMSHSTFRGQMPDETYLGTEGNVLTELARGAPGSQPGTGLQRL